MRIKCLKIAGFRGFNEERVIDFHNKLTVISAPNSHGKTSVSEALEFLLYGATSRVRHADSKEEYKDSYRNRHFAGDKKSYVEAILITDQAQELTLRAEIHPDGVVFRFVDGKSVTEWPFHTELDNSPQPFVLQHALKYLLHVVPAERFNGFAKLLGLDEVEAVFKVLVNLCTKPIASIPDKGRQVLAELEGLESQIEQSPKISKVAKLFKKGIAEFDRAYELIEKRADEVLNAALDPHQRLQALLEARAAATSKVYKGGIALHQLSPAQESQMALNRGFLAEVVSKQFLQDYGDIAVQTSVSRLMKKAELLELGLELLDETSVNCPLCNQPLDKQGIELIHEHSAAIAEQLKLDKEKREAGSRLKDALNDIDRVLGEHEKTILIAPRDLVAVLLPDNLPKIIELLGGPGTPMVLTVTTKAGEMRTLCDELKLGAEKVRNAARACRENLKSNKIEISNAEELAVGIHNYLKISDSTIARIKDVDKVINAPAKYLQSVIDANAGTAELSLLINLLEKKQTVLKALRIRECLLGLKDLKKCVEQTLGETMETVMTSDLTTAVMKWYARIKTLGDPEVHFSGFSMDRTKAGEFKNRKLAVKAQSYGVELASAVSSLSESKLNALGLCISIASSVRRPGLWSFLVIDDPIQSWDDDHELQFIDVIRALVEQEGKQLVVLSHKSTWTKQVCDGCRTINGYKYEMTGYDQKGPHIIKTDWTPIDQRLREADSIANDKTATSVRLQQAEEELRLAACEIASAIADRCLGRKTSPHNLNSKDVRAILISAGIPSGSVDKIQAIFANADDSHHAPKTYQPNAQRIRQAIPILRSIQKFQITKPQELRGQNN